MWEAIREVVGSRELLLALAYRDLRIRYKQTLMGAAWALAMPILMMAVFVQVFSRVARVDTGGVPYPVFVFCGLLPWQFFAASLKGSVESLTRNNRLVTKIYFPREVFPLSQIVSAAVDFVVASTILAALLIWYRVVPGPWAAFVPAVLLVQVLFSCALALLLAMGNLFFRDVKYVFEFGLTIWMFVTSVMYPISLSGPWGAILALNPMTPIIDAYRRTLLLGLPPDWLGFGYASALSVGLFVLAVRWFHESEYLFAEAI